MKYAKSKYWSDAIKIYATDGDKRYFPVLLSADGEEVVCMISGAKNGIEIAEGETVEMSLTGDLAEYSFIMKGSIDISDTIKTNGSYSFQPSVYFRENMIRTFAYQTKDVNVTSCGTLINEVGRDNIENLYSLKVSGELDGTDILTISKMKNLRRIDMSDATIVNGGATYYQNYITSSKTIGEYFFRNKDYLINIILPKNTMTIKSNAFTGCRRLKTILIPSSVAPGGKAFEGCDSLESAKILCPKTGSFFKGLNSLRKVVLGNDVNTISENAFFGCYHLEQIEIPNSVQTIERNAFYNCENLRSINIPEGVSSINKGTFLNCKRLTNIVLPISVTKIEEDAFRECTNLESINLPSGLVSIGGFRGCESLKSIVIPEGVKKIKGTFSRCMCLESITLPQGLEQIDISCLFEQCTNLKSVSLPDCVTNIGYSTFGQCYQLQSIDIPQYITTIYASSFEDCFALTSITIPNKVNSISKNAFKNCYRLREIHSLNPIPPIIEDNTFEKYHYRNTSLYVPENSVSIYWLHPYWENFFNVESEGTGIETIEIDSNSKYDNLYNSHRSGIYNLNGTRVNGNSLGKGIYIVNGKKVVVK